jgi:Ca-activated chloride channel family protein
LKVAVKLGIMIGLLLMIHQWSYGQTALKKTEPLKKTRILFLLDGSGSMLAKWESSDRMKVAKILLSKLVDSLAQYENLELALRVYGHQFDKEKNNCTDSRLEVAFKEGNEEQIKTRLKQIVPRGNTPITYSLEQAAKDFPVDKNARNVLILITDGLESCGGDPCAMAKALQKKRIFLKPFVIGIGIEKQFVPELACMGQYFNAADISSFRKVLDNVVKMALSKTTVSVELKDEQGKPVETNVNLTFINNVTEEPEYNYVHYLSAAGKTDVLDIDALLSYDLVVNTVPPVILKDLDIKPGEHNVFSAKTPQGTLYLRQDAVSPFGVTEAIVREKNSKNTLVALRFGSRQKLLTGTYDLELLTLPRMYLNDVEIKQSQTNTITFPPPGLLNIPTELQGFGSLYVLEKDGSQRWIYNLPESNSRTNLPLQPGQYRLVYRTKTANASKFTDVQNFEIRSAATTTIKLFR